MKKVAVVLSGCGFMDGSEINEAVFTLLCLDKADAAYQCFAPDKNQYHVINHLTGEPTEETRNVLVESARIARGEVRPLSDFDAKDYDALLFPGGFGAAKNLCDFAFEGENCQVYPEITQAVHQMHAAKKPVGFICIAPAMIPKLYPQGAKSTIGTDRDTAAKITAMGGDHQDCAVTDIIVDDTHKVVSTPAYMLAERLSEAYTGIEKLVSKVLSFT